MAAAVQRAEKAVTNGVLCPLPGIEKGKVETRQGFTGNVHPALGINRHIFDAIVVIAAEIAGITQLPAGIKGREEAVLAAVLDGLPGVEHRHVGGLRSTDQPCGAIGVHGDAVSVIPPRTAEVAGIAELAGGIEFGDEGIIPVTGRGLAGLPGIQHGEIRRFRIAADVAIAAAIHGNACAVFKSTAAQVGGEHRLAAGIEFGHKGIVAPERRAMPCIDGRHGGNTARHPCIAGGIRGDGIAFAARTKIGGINRLAGGIQRSHKGRPGIAGVCGLIGIQHGEVVGLGLAGDIGAAGAVHGDAITVVIAAAAEIGRVFKLTGGIEFGDKGIVIAGNHTALPGVEHREIRRNGIADDVGIAESIHGNVMSRINGAAAEKGGISQHRVNNQRMLAVVGGQFESNGIVIQPIAAVNHMPFTVNLLIHDRLVLNHLALADGKHKIAGIVNSQRIRARKAHPDGRRIRSGRNDEIEFQLFLIPVIGQINARIYIPVGDASKHRHAGVPLLRLIADKIIAMRGKLFRRLHGRMRVGADKRHPQQREFRRCFLLLHRGGKCMNRSGNRLPRGRQRQHRSIIGQKQSVARPARGKPHSLIELTAIGLECKRQTIKNRRKRRSGYIGLPLDGNISQ